MASFFCYNLQVLIHIDRSKAMIFALVDIDVGTEITLDYKVNIVVCL